MKTILTKDPKYQRTIGQERDISFTDIKTANIAYCKNKCINKLPCQRNGYINPRTCTSCVCPDGFTGTLCDQLDSSSRMISHLISFKSILFKTFKFLIATCGGTLTSAAALQSPNYPNNYATLRKCFWHIKVPLTHESPSLINLVVN